MIGEIREHKSYQEHYPDELSHCYGCGRPNEHDLSIPDQSGAAKEKGFFSTLCSRYVHDAATILEEML